MKPLRGFNPTTGRTLRSVLTEIWLRANTVATIGLRIYKCNFSLLRHLVKIGPYEKARQLHRAAVDADVGKQLTKKYS